MRKYGKYRFELIAFFLTVSVFTVFFSAIANLANWDIPGSRNRLTSIQNDAEQNQDPLANRFSTGTLSLLPTPSIDKQQGITAYAARDYAQAVTHFETALQASRNDPEALIYLNNAQIATQKSYTIAVIAPVGKAGEIGLEILRGVAQAQREINQLGGAEGVPIKVMIVNDDNDPEIADDLAEQLVKDPAILGVVGHYSSGVTLAAAPIYDQGKLPMISAISTSVKLSGLSPYIFRTVPSDSFAAAELARYMINDLGATRAVLYYDSNSAYSLSLKNEFATSVFSDGGEIVVEYDLADPNFDAERQLSSAQAQTADVIMLAASTDTLEPSLAIMAENNRRLPLIGGDDLYHPHVLEVGGSSVEGLVVAVPWHVLADPESEFVQASRELWGGDVSWRTAMAYDAVSALAVALAQATPSREGVRLALQTPEFFATGATGTVRFLPSGDRNRPSQLVEVRAGQRSGSGFDFVPVRSN
jgi:branched-chain amino acid transport system substrate-binding protein